MNNSNVTQDYPVFKLDITSKKTNSKPADVEKVPSLAKFAENHLFRLWPKKHTRVTTH